MKASAIKIYVSIILLNFPASPLACQPPYQLISGFCQHVNTSAKVSWCEANRLCQDIGGELLTDPTVIRAVASLTSGSVSLWLGVTDFLVERGTVRTGWLTNNGSEFSATVGDWGAGKPNDRRRTDDMLALMHDGLSDTVESNRLGFVCQPIMKPFSGRFSRRSFLGLGDITPYYCYTEIHHVLHYLDCLKTCTIRWQCRAALYSRAEAACRMLDYADASVGDPIEGSGKWEKFVKYF